MFNVWSASLPNLVRLPLHFSLTVVYLTRLALGFLPILKHNAHIIDVKIIVTSFTFEFGNSLDLE